MNTRLLLLFCLAPLAAWPSPAADLYYLTREIPIGGSGSWGSMSLDAAGRRLYLAHSTRVVVVDLDKEQLLSTITGTPGVHGFAAAPDVQRGFTSNGRDGTVSVVDLRTLKTLSKANAGEGPDAIVYEPENKEVYVFNEASRSVTILNATTGATSGGAIPLPGKPTAAVVDAAAGHVYCAIEDKNEIAALDVKTHAVAGVWPVAPGKEPISLAIDPDHHRLFVGCRSQRLAMMDGATGNIIDIIPVGSSAEACAYDPETRLVICSGSSYTTVIRADGNKMGVVKKLILPGARAVGVDPRTHKLYLATASHEAPTSDDATRRGRMIPNTLKIEVYSMGQDAP